MKKISFIILMLICYTGINAQENLLGEIYSEISTIHGNFQTEKGKTSSGNLMINVLSKDNNGDVYVLHQYIFNGSLSNSICTQYGMNVFSNQLQTIIDKYNNLYKRNDHGWFGNKGKGVINGRIFKVGNDHYRSEWTFTRTQF